MAINNFGMRSRFNLEEMAMHRDRCNQYKKIAYYREVPTRGGLKGKIILFAKKVIRKCAKFLIEPIVEDQNKFNVAMADAVNILYNQGVIMQEFLDAHEINKQKLLDDISLLEGEIRLLKQENMASHEKFAELYSKYEKLSSEFDAAEMNFLRIVNSKVPSLNKSVEKIDSDCIGMDDAAENGDVYDKIDYFKFENHFRGSRQRIKEVQEIYLPYFKEKKNVVDIGCGRGEFLEVLQEHNIGYIGVDLYKDYVDFCKVKGLNAVVGDAIEYIADLEDDTIDGLFSAQLVEHLETDQIVRLCNLAYKKLSSDGCFIMETPNPLSLSIYKNAFYLDPSHNKPVHPKFLEYLLLEAGFKKIDILFPEHSRPDNKLPLLKGSNIDNLDEFNAGIAGVREVLFGSQDYAVIAYK